MKIYLNTDSGFKTWIHFKKYEWMNPFCREIIEGENIIHHSEGINSAESIYRESVDFQLNPSLFSHDLKLHRGQVLTQ